MNDKEEERLGFLGSATLLLIILKIFGVIHWSWWIILIGVWVPLLIMGIILLAGLLLFIWED